MSPGYSMCGSCSAVALALGRAPIPVTPFAVVGPGCALYRTLRQYKSGEPAVARWQAAQLASALGEWWVVRGAQVAPGGVDVGTVVPSASGGRPPPHPLERVVDAARPRLPGFARLLDAGTEPVAHRRPSLGAYQLASPASMVRGRRVLLLDDVYTSGAHLQSAAAVLLDAGAASVVGLVIARFVPAARVPRRARPAMPWPPTVVAR